jgi:hypothetical protein
VHSIRHSGGAARDRVTAVNFHHAELAATLGLQVRMGTDMGHINARVQSSVQDTDALLCFDLDTIDPKCYLSHNPTTSHFLNFWKRRPWAAAAQALAL